MKIEYKQYQYGEFDRECEVSDYVEDIISDTRLCDGELERLHTEVQQLRRAFCRLCDVLAEKGGLSAEEIVRIVYGFYRDEARFVQKEINQNSEKAPF